MRLSGWEKALLAEAKKAGMFCLPSESKVEFFSSQTGRMLLTWFRDSHKWTTPQRDKGYARSPFGALHAAIAIDRNRSREVRR